jgi:hypothetical protein
MAIDWLPSRLAEQATMFENIDAKIDTYAGVLGLTPAQVAAIHLICAEFDNAYTYTEQFRATTLAVVGWRDQILKGTPQGEDAPAAPNLAAPLILLGAKIGIINEFRDLRDIMLAAPGYTDTIGQDLMIVAGASGGGPSIPDSAVPVLKLQTGSGYEITVGGAMRGMDAMRVEWQRNGGDFVLVGFLTKTPGVVIITPHTPGDPESGNLRARYISNNVPTGEYSANYPVTVSA